MQEEQIREALKKPGRRRRPAMQTRNTIFTTKMPFVTILSQGRPAYTVSIMEFRNGKVVRETQYFAGSLRGASLAEPMGSADAALMRD